MEEVKKIANGFMTVDPQNSSYYQKNANTLDAKLTQIDKEFMQNLSDCKLRDFVTSHAAFGYLAKQYGLNQITISGISPDAEPSTRQLANVAKVAKEKQVKYIFFESLISPKLSETIANEIGADTLVLDPLEGLSDDDIKEGKNYFTVMRENLKNLKLALQCTK
jgi:zinc transport system substrate-binding protein